MSPRRLFVPLGVALVLLAGYNVLIALSAHRSQRQEMRQKLDHLPATANCVFLGNSLVEAGCDPDAFAAALPQTERGLVPINLALGATTPVEHYLILKRALASPDFHPRYLIYGFFDDQLNAPVRGDWSDLVGNRAFSYYYPNTAAAFYAPDSRFKAWQLSGTERIPMLAERSSLWTKIELLRRNLEDIGMPPHKTTRFGRASDFSALEASDIESFNRRCMAVLDGRIGFSPPVRGIFQLAREHGIKVVLVEMPMPSTHRERFYASPVWPKLRTYLQSLAAADQIVYVSASDWVRDDHDFEDAMHLNEAGAKVFSAELARAISGLAEKRVEVAVGTTPANATSRRTAFRPEK